MLFIAAFLASSGLALGLRPLPCAPHRQLFATYDHLGETLEHFEGLYAGYAHGRPKIISEHVKAYQLHALAQDFLDIIDAFRLFSCIVLCPQACLFPGQDPMQALRAAGLVEKLNNLQLDVELLVDDEGYDIRRSSQGYLRESKQYAATLLATAPQTGGQGIDWDEAATACVARVGSRVLFPLMQVVSLMGKQNESEVILGAVSIDPDNPASTSVSYITPRPEALAALNEGADLSTLPPEQVGEISFKMLHQIATNGRSLKLSSGPADESGAAASMCTPGLSPLLSGVATGSVGSGWPRRWRLQHGATPVPQVIQMLEHIEASALELSHWYMALRPVGGRDGWAQNFSCTGSEVQYDPTLCLEVKGWGGYVYSINVHPPFVAELRVVGRNMGDASQMGPSSFLDVLRPYPQHADIETVSIEHMYHRIDWMWRQSAEPSPDVFFLHPATHNCHAVEYLFTGAPLKPKVLIVPINPLIPPPFQVTPRFEAWWHMLRPALTASQSGRSWVLHNEESEAQEEPQGDSHMDMYLAPAFWFGQCSLAAVVAILYNMGLRKFKYVLHHVDGAYAVFLREDLQKAMGGGAETMKAGDREHLKLWLEGWQCRAESRFFAKLELSAGPDVVKLVDPAITDSEKEAILCHFLDRHRIPVQKRNFDCANVIAANEAAGDGSCLFPDLRGWGNEPVASESAQDVVGDCEAHCKSKNCSYWTFDPTSMYGRPLCWIWVGGRPAEIKPERGWISGDADCLRDQDTKAANPDAAASTPVEDDDEADVPPVAVGGGASASSAGGRRELFKQWAVQQPLEQPGMRYFLEAGSRGRCVRGFCECFPPYRGPLCEQMDGGAFDHQRNFSGVLHYLTSDDPDDIEDIQHSLPRLWRRFNRRFDYPVVIFNDGLSEAHRWKIVRASDNRIWFAYVDDYMDVPDFIMKDPSRRAALDEVKWSVGYRGMCRFRSGTIFLQPVLRNFQYAMTLDTDGYFPAKVAADPIAQMHAGGYVYTWSHLLPDLPGAVRHFWDYSLMYMRMKGIHPRGTSILQQFIRAEDLQWNYQLYMNDIEIVQLDWFRSDPYQDYFRYLDSMGGFWLHRWGDHAVRTIAVGMWLPEEKVFEMDVPYGHQNYCRCSGAHPRLRCVREGDVGGTPERWWTCAEGGEEE